MHLKANFLSVCVPQCIIWTSDLIVWNTFRCTKLHLHLKQYHYMLQKIALWWNCFIFHWITFNISMQVWYLIYLYVWALKSLGFVCFWFFFLLVAMLDMKKFRVFCKILIGLYCYLLMVKTCNNFKEKNKWSQNTGGCLAFSKLTAGIIRLVSGNCIKGLLFHLGVVSLLLQFIIKS